MTNRQPKQSAYSIRKLLEQRHSKDVFISECKDGPTHYSSHLRMDAWVMNKSWALPVSTAYEIKVSRADFLKDNKWPSYLPLCNQFYFVAPKNLIDVSELPPEAGLLVVAGTGDGTRLLTKKKSPHRDVQIPEEVYKYILMCRVVVGSEAEMRTDSGPEYWQKWLEQKSENQKLAYRVSRRINEIASRLESENYELNARINQYESVKKMLDEMQIDPHRWNIVRDVQQRIEASQTVFDPKLITAMRDARNKIDTALTIAGAIEDEQIAKTA